MKIIHMIIISNLIVACSDSNNGESVCTHQSPANYAQFSLSELEAKKEQAQKQEEWQKIKRNTNLKR